MGVGEVRKVSPEEMIAVLDERIEYAQKRIAENLASARFGIEHGLRVPVDMSLVDKLAQLYLQSAPLRGAEYITYMARAVLLNPRVALQNPYQARTDTTRNVHKGKDERMRNVTLYDIRLENKVAAYSAEVAEEIAAFVHELRSVEPENLEHIADWDEDGKSMLRLLSDPFQASKDTTADEMAQQIAAEKRR